MVPALRFRHAEPKAVAGVNVTWYLKSMNCAHKISRVVQILPLGQAEPKLVIGINVGTSRCLVLSKYLSHICAPLIPGVPGALLVCSVATLSQGRGRA